ncbi:MAG TPA: iron-containing alcohol dehydrogenase [Bacteroidales bacterium]|mgnify:CR=1 FL=1|nr:iron-containing alcohol dehydrogenase [Bacteroidales bacterium]
MKNFEFYNPVKILFGEGQIDKIPQEILPYHTILIAYGRGSIKRNGVYEKVVNALNGKKVIEFGGIEPNPRYETLMKAIKLARENNVDFVLAVGGGSVIDGTKFIVASVPFEGEPWDIVSKDVKVENAIPFGTVLTLPATGSEMNAGAVISRDATKEKYAFSSPAVFPKFSVLDPTVTYSLPKHQVANGVVDAFAHVLEQYLTYPSNSTIQDRFAEGILQTLIEVGPKTLENPTDNNLRATFMWSCTMALNGLISTGVPTDWATHMIGHELTAFLGLDHGVTLAIIYPALLTEMAEFKKEKLLQYASRVWYLSGNNLTPERAIEETEKFFRSLGVKTRLPEHGISHTDIKPIVDRFVARGWKLGENQNITPDVVEKILRRALEPYR